jgi:putative cell wall-binding protein
MRKAGGLPSRVLVLVIVLGLLVLPTSAASASTHENSEIDFISRINAERSQRGLGTLTRNTTQLTGVARNWSGVMAAEDRMYHNPNLAQQVTEQWSRLGENVGYSIQTGASEATLVERLHRAFMDSPPHRANILGAYNQVGVGVLVTAAGKMWVTVVFMQGPVTQPAPAPAPAPAPVESSAAQIDEAIRVSQDVFPATGAAQYVVLARAEVFADALGGAGLAGSAAPILFTPGPTAANGNPALDRSSRAEIDRVLGGRGKVYILGGTAAVSDAVAGELTGAGYQVVRLSGPSRIETAIRVAREIRSLRGDTGEVLIARADEWPDAVTGGAYAAFSGSPLILTDRGRLHPAVAAFLAEAAPARRWALGGQAALTDAVVAAAGATRISGSDRTATAVAVAQELWGRRAAHLGDQYVSTPSHGGAAWAFALAYAPYSAVKQSPQLLVGSDVPTPVRTYLSQLGYRDGIRGDVRAASPVPVPVVEGLRALVAG